MKTLTGIPLRRGRECCKGPAGDLCCVGMRAPYGICRWLAVVGLVIAGLDARAADEVRYLSGAPVRGTVKSVSPEGVEVQSGNASRVYPWNMLSAGTRFRLDPVYRVNLPAIQQGAPVAARTNELETGYLSAPPAADASSAGSTGALMAPAVTSLLAAASAGPIDLGRYDAVNPLPRAAVAQANLRNGDAALAWGLHFGSPVEQVVYFLFDVKEPGELPEGMVIYSPADGRADRIKVSRKTDGADALAQFRKLRYQGTMADVACAYDVACIFSSRQPAQLLVSLEIELARGGLSAAFQLLGAAEGVLEGDGAMTASQVLAKPSLWMTADTSSGEPVLVGNVRMGRLRFVPRRGMDTAVRVVIADEAGAVAVDESVAVTAKGPQDRYTLKLPLDKLKPGRKYALKASMDLGPLLGPLRYEESLVLPEILRR